MVGAPDRRWAKVLLPRGHPELRLGEAGGAHDTGGACGQRHELAGVQDLGWSVLLLQQGYQGQLLEHASGVAQVARGELRCRRPAYPADGCRDAPCLLGAYAREGRGRELDMAGRQRGHARRAACDVLERAHAQAVLRRAGRLPLAAKGGRGPKARAGRRQRLRAPHRGAVRQTRRPQRHVRGGVAAARRRGGLGPYQVGRSPR
mmetsp:Transcript_43381/g.125400  ORF Transcript_43381/g.125400 Transcript_43381/m.125400 type:complete len:204 (-) Transcript_43381:866-1477(-)